MELSSNIKSFYEYIVFWLKNITGAIYNAWNYTLYTTTDKQPITLANIIIGLLLMIVGMKLARKCSMLARKKILDTMDIDNNIRVILETIIRYLMMIFITLVILDVSHVPLTSLTLIGSALAVGVGFGSQSILNNFMSGLVIMIEQPIRVGDYVDIDSVIGRVVNIGARCINIITPDNMDVLIPNSVVLQNKVINWTLNDDIVRVSMSIPVIISLDSKSAEEHIMQVVDYYPDILKFPRPMLYFDSYIERDRDMNFLLCFWIESNKVDRRKIVSDIHHGVRTNLNKLQEDMTAGG
jgi:small-conductance mechanosensitive channel